MTLFKRKLIITEDGSHSLSIPDMDEQYHSIHGAIQESNHVFIQAGINGFVNESELNILEFGFGTGLNALLTNQWAELNKISINYHSLEKYPLTKEEYEPLNYGRLLDADFSKVFMNLHDADWEKSVKISDYFSLIKSKRDFKKFESDIKFHGIYFDAFAPDKQPDLWELCVFENLFNCLSEEGFLVTYCAKGQVRRNMIQAGFTVERIPGPPGKRHMLRAIKKVF